MKPYTFTSIFTFELVRVTPSIPFNSLWRKILVLSFVGLSFRVFSVESHPQLRAVHVLDGELCICALINGSHGREVLTSNLELFGESHDHALELQLR